MRRAASSARVSRLSVSCGYGKNKQKKLITEIHRTQQTMWQELIQTDREVWNVHSDSFMVYLSL